MKSILLLLVLSIGTYYVITQHSPFQTELTDPYYVEIRIEDRKTGVELVGLGKMLSYEDCQARAAIVWASTLEHIGKVKTDMSCTKELPERYIPLFDNQQFHASYLVFEKGTGAERDGRFIIYGVPSSYVAKECSKLISKIKQKYKGNVYCIQGSVG